MGLTGQTSSRSNVNKETAEMQKGLVEYLTKMGFQGWNPEANAEDPSIMAYRKFFADQNMFNMAQAKESAGNLTGSGFANTMGNAAGRASTEQGAFLTNMMEQKRRSDADRYVQLLLGTMGSPAGQRQSSYQPGFLDYAMQGAAFAVPLMFDPTGTTSAAITGSGVTRGLLPQDNTG